MRIGRGVALTVAALSLVSVAQASAAQRFASPGGSGATCTSGAPCSISQAINVAGPNDEVIVNPGSYGTPGTPILGGLTNVANISVHGVAGAPRPQIFSSALIPLDLEGPNSTLQHLEIYGSASSNGAVLRFIGSVAEDFIASGSLQRGCEALGGATLRDGVCQSTGSNTQNGFLSQTATAPVSQVTLRNMTILSATGPGLGISSAAARPSSVTAINSIARGGAGQPDLDVFSGGNANATLTISHDNFATKHTSVQNATTGIATIADDGTGQSGTPLLGSDFHQLAGSPTIDAGITDPANGSLDFDGDARALGASTDIGADELVPPAVPGAARPLTALTPHRKCRHHKRRHHSAAAAKKRHGCKHKRKHH